ncbi:VOC family protein [Novosphingobium album (ex Liu et al. 2023)]|uniref:VOC family protein n=1 Tax=Novosphingobium album (ex Liu et al. 2023) TaxID=3031130 RepID=A0ABT5WQ89_9SPHN|nr:VOC family protein [Novosphingobium album (ex Liu et al. 2023)]MDE8652202.1 VOC family protein [Novosphingobium album (ex Liu et al. 2023)]
MFSRYRLHHVGVIVPSLDDADRYITKFEHEEDFRGYVERWSCWCIFTKAAAGPAIELVVADGGALARFNKGGGGVHHFAYLVDDLTVASRWCEDQGLRMLEAEAVQGAGRFLCNFINPLDTRGIQIELVQLL